MKYQVNVPFLWFRRGDIVDSTRIQRLDFRYLVKKGIVEEVVEKKKRSKKGDV